MWDYLDHRELAGGGTVVYHWPMTLPEPYCEASRRPVLPVRNSRCLDHRDSDRPCQTEVRYPPECRHEELLCVDGYPRCAECGLNGEDVTDQVLSSAARQPADGAP